MDTSKVTRVELIDHTPCSHCKGTCIITDTVNTRKPCPACSGMGTAGRTVIFWDNRLKVDLSLQDNSRTLKIFVSEKEEQ